MNESKTTMAQQNAQVAIAFEHRRRGNHGPKSVTVVQSEGTLLITPHEALSTEEKALATSPAEPLRSRSSTAGCLPTIPARSGRRLRESQAWKCARRPQRSSGSQALWCGLARPKTWSTCPSLSVAFLRKPEWEWTRRSVISSEILQVGVARKSQVSCFAGAAPAWDEYGQFLSVTRSKANEHK